MNHGRTPSAIARTLVLGAIAAFAPVLHSSDAAGETRSARGTDGWTIHSHPCPGGNRTDALHRDLNGVLWVGCGTNAEGYGLYRSGGRRTTAAVIRHRAGPDLQ